MLLEHKYHGTRLQSEVAILSNEKTNVELQIEVLVSEISEFEEGVRNLDHEVLELSKLESESTGVLDEDARYRLREQKMRLDTEFRNMIAKIADRKEQLEAMEHKLRVIDRQKQEKEEQIRDLEKKLVVLLEDQTKQIDEIRMKQDSRTQALVDIASGKAPGGVLLARSGESSNANHVGGGGVTQKQKQDATALMESAETMMKFGYTAMSMTYFSSMNMVKAMRKVGAHHTIMSGGGGGEMGSSHPVLTENRRNGEGYSPFRPALRSGQMPGQQPLQVGAWSVQDVGRWLDTLMLHQYKESFYDAAIDGAFLYELSDEVCRFAHMKLRAYTL